MTIAYTDNELYMEQVLLSDLVKQVGTPTYVYSQACLQSRLSAYMSALERHNTSKQTHQIRYAVKANSNLSILKWLAETQIGFDVVSLGELDRVMRAGAQAKKVVFSGVGKTQEELKAAILLGIGCFNIESESEFYQLSNLAQALQKVIDIAFRVNPDIDPKTHPYISTGLEDNKFGIDIPLAKTLYLESKKNKHVNPIGIACHIGSQIETLTPFKDALNRVLDLVNFLQENQIMLQHIDMGGGLGIPYEPDSNIPSIKEYIDALCLPFKDRLESLFVEPGRSLIGESGILLTQVNIIKKKQKKTFAVIDAGMNDLLRPALYQAKHRICSLTVQPGIPKSYHVVGPVCESSDQFFDHELSIQEGDYLSILDVGAYGMSLASSYNSRPKPVEVLVNQKTWKIIRHRESYEQLCQLEII